MQRSNDVTAASSLPRVLLALPGIGVLTAVVATLLIAGWMTEFPTQGCFATLRGVEAIGIVVESVPPVPPRDGSLPPLIAIVGTEPPVEEDGPRESVPEQWFSSVDFASPTFGPRRGNSSAGHLVGPFLSADRLSRLSRLNC